MKHWTILFILQLMLHLSLQAQSTSAIDKANDFYANYTYDSAVVYFKRAQKLMEPESEDFYRISFRIGQSYSKIGVFDESIHYFKVASAGFKKLGKLDNYYIAQGNIASNYDEIGEYDEAVRIGTEIARYFEEQKDTAYWLNNLYNISLYHYHKNDTDASLKLLLQVVDLAGNDFLKIKTNALNQLGNIWADALANEQKALEYYQKAQSIKLQINDPYSISAGYNNIGLSHKNLEQQDSAMYYYLLAYDYAKISQSPSAMINAEINIGNLLKKQDLFTEAIPYFLKAYNRYDHASLNQQVLITTVLGNLYSDLKDFKKAIKFLHEAKVLNDKQGNTKDLLDIYNYLAFAYYSTNQFKEAYEHQLSYSQLLIEYERDQRKSELTDALIKYEAAEKEKELLRKEHEINLQNVENSKLKIFVWSISIILILLIIGIYFFIKRKQAEIKGEKLEVELAKQAVVSKVQEDRLRISRELHDNIGSYLTFINASVENLNNDQQLSKDERISSVRNMLKKTMKELRNTVWILNNENASIDEIALRMREFLAGDNRVSLTIDIIGNDQVLLNEVQTTHLIRIIQEAVNNAYKYAQTDKIDIVFNISDKQIEFEIRDYGVGFDTSSQTNGNGLRNMQYRIAELKGKLHQESIINEGTIVKGSFPI